jgi:UDP-N-acetylglucosamine 1-carboxyvinyltransferase
MESFIIEGRRRLRGTITPVGNKNTALPLLAASLLTDETLELTNVPNIGDVRVKFDLLRGMGGDVEVAGSRCSLNMRNVGDRDPDPGLCSKIRSAPLLAGPLLARRGHVEIGRPGGDAIGRRRLDTHLMALKAMGAEMEIGEHTYRLSANGLRGCDIFLDEMSVTGTEQAILAAVLAKGDTTLSNAASEPHVQELIACLIQMGAQISGSGTNTLHIQGVASLRGTSYQLGPDYMEVGSLIALAAATGSEIRIANARPLEQRMTRIMFGRLGVRWTDDGGDIVVPDEQELRVQTDFDGAIPKIDDMPWPGFPPDLISVAVVLATQARGTVLIHQKMFDRRLVFVDSLIEMGAAIVLCDPHRAVVVGPSQLSGKRLTSPDIRAGMALLIAALAADGTSVIQNVHQIDRGYEKLEVRLQALGACIERRVD